MRRRTGLTSIAAALALAVAACGGANLELDRAHGVFMTICAESGASQNTCEGDWDALTDDFHEEEVTAIVRDIEFQLDFERQLAALNEHVRETP